MKQLIAISILGSLLLTGVLASATEIISAQQIDQGTLSLTIKTELYCNDPIVSLDYQRSGKASFGPHFYSVPVLGVNRMLCLGTDSVTVLVALPNNMRAGDVMVFKGTDGAPQFLRVQ